MTTAKKILTFALCLTCLTAGITGCAKDKSSSDTKIAKSTSSQSESSDSEKIKELNDKLEKLENTLSNILGEDIFDPADGDGTLARPDNYTPELKWETTTTYNVGMDWGILNQRLSGSLDWYYRKTTDLLNYAPTEALSAFRNQSWQNIGSMMNTGIEAAISWKAVQSHGWYWTLDYNFTYNYNKILDLKGVSATGDPVPNTSFKIGTDKYLEYNQVGHPMNSYWVYQQAYDANGKPIENAVVNAVMAKVMDDNFVEYIADTVMDIQTRESSVLPALRHQLEETERGITNMLNAIQMGIINASTKQRLDELEDRKADIELQIIQEEMKHPMLTREDVTYWICRFRTLDVSKLEERRRLIDSFVNSVTVFDDYILITFNYKEGEERLDFTDIESSDLQSVRGPWVSPIRAHPLFNNLQISFESGTEMYYFFLFAAYM